MSQLQYLDPIVEPALDKHTATVIILHGLGDQGDGWSDTAEQMRPALRHAKFVFPHAPERAISLNGGEVMPGWFDLDSLDLEQAMDGDGIAESRRYVEELIAVEAAAGVPSHRVVVAGFSQGGAIALEMLRSDIKLAAVVGLSTFLGTHTPGPYASDANRATPVLMCHGDSDSVVEYKYGKASADKLSAEGVSVQLKTYRGMGHSSSPAEMRDMLAFLQSALPSA